MGGLRKEVTGGGGSGWLPAASGGEAKFPGVVRKKDVANRGGTQPADAQPWASMPATQQGLSASWMAAVCTSAFVATLAWQGSVSSLVTVAAVRCSGALYSEGHSMTAAAVVWNSSAMISKMTMCSFRRIPGSFKLVCKCNGTIIAEPSQNHLRGLEIQETRHRRDNTARIPAFDRKRVVQHQVRGDQGSGQNRPSRIRQAHVSATVPAM